MPLTPQRCADARDALAKGLFSYLFDWLVGTLNEGMAAAAPAAPAAPAAAAIQGGVRTRALFVGFLDVFGFENFEAAALPAAYYYIPHTTHDSPLITQHSLLSTYCPLWLCSTRCCRSTPSSGCASTTY